MSVVSVRASLIRRRGKYRRAIQCPTRQSLDVRPQLRKSFAELVAIFRFHYLDIPIPNAVEQGPVALLVGRLTGLPPPPKSHVDRSERAPLPGQAVPSGLVVSDTELVQPPAGRRPKRDDFDICVPVSIPPRDGDDPNNASRFPEDDLRSIVVD